VVGVLGSVYSTGQDLARDNREGFTRGTLRDRRLSAVADILGSPKQPAEPRSPPQVFEPVPAHKLESAAPRERLRERGRKGQRSILWIAGLALGVVIAGLMAVQVWGPESTQRVKPVMETPEVRRGGAPPEPQPEEAETARKGVGVIKVPIISTPKVVSIKDVGALKPGASTNISLAQNEHAILIDGKIAPGEEFGVGIDDSMQKRNWLSEAIDNLELKYPGNLHWAALFITVGEPVDFSAYRILQVQMKGETGGECVKVGIKDNNDPDNGKEPKSPVTLESSWKTYDFDIRNDFDIPREKIHHSPLDMKKLHVLTELVFPCREKNKSQTVYVKNIRFVR
jgi:hypothetical protein